MTAQSDTAKFLFIGGIFNGELIEVPVADEAVEAYSILRAAIPPEMPNEYTLRNLIMKRIPERYDKYTKRQVVHPDKPGRSMPIFVENKILEDDKWLEDIEPSILDQLWLKDGDGNPVGHEPIEEVEKPHPHLCFEHGGSLACEEHNAKHGFQCPKCKAAATEQLDTLMECMSCGAETKADTCPKCGGETEPVDRDGV